MADDKTAVEEFAFSSSIAEDIWHPKSDEKAYEWWYFDALSDDGRDAVVIIFLDNFVFSPRYNCGPELAQAADDGLLQLNMAAPDGPTSVPAVAFFYYRDGKPIYRAINEFRPDEFDASTDSPSCRIGDNFFRFESAPYGNGYFISIKTLLHRDFVLEGTFEWLSIESDLRPGGRAESRSTHFWNLVVPRADVSGRVSVSDGTGKNLDIIHFRGTGYHDHNYDHRWLPDTVSEWLWGRAHFHDSTAVFYLYKPSAEGEAVARLLTVGNGTLTDEVPAFYEKRFSRDVFGIRFPKQIGFEAGSGAKMNVSHTKTIDSSFFYLRFLSDMTFTFPNGETRQAVGITEHLAPRALRYRWLDWLVDMRIGRLGRGSFLP